MGSNAASWPVSLADQPTWQRPSAGSAGRGQGAGGRGLRAGAASAGQCPAAGPRAGGSAPLQGTEAGGSAPLHGPRAGGSAQLQGRGWQGAEPSCRGSWQGAVPSCRRGWQGAVPRGQCAAGLAWGRSLTQTLMLVACPSRLTRLTRLSRLSLASIPTSPHPRHQVRTSPTELVGTQRATHGGPAGAVVCPPALPGAHPGPSCRSAAHGQHAGLTCCPFQGAARARRHQGRRRSCSLAMRRSSGPSGACTGDQGRWCLS